VKRALAKAYRSRLWVDAPGWKEKRERCKTLTNNEALFTFASKELGLIQVPSEILAFVDFVNQRKPNVVGEIGLKNGGNTLLFLRALPTVQTMISLDLQVNNEGRIRSLARPGQRFVCIEGDTHTPKVRQKLERTLRGQRFDILFIDGDHSYEGVKQDHTQYESLVRDGGLIAFHDIVPDHRGTQGSDCVGNCYAGGVHRYWAEIKDQYAHWQFVESWAQNGFGIGVLRK
jgi:cephalosporin hydroxylase